jgi:hypothetical protein
MSDLSAIPPGRHPAVYQENSQYYNGRLTVSPPYKLGGTTQYVINYDTESLGSKIRESWSPVTDSSLQRLRVELPDNVTLQNQPDPSSPASSDELIPTAVRGKNVNSLFEILSSDEGISEESSLFLESYGEERFLSDALKKFDDDFEGNGQMLRPLLKDLATCAQASIDRLKDQVKKGWKSGYTDVKRWQSELLSPCEELSQDQLINHITSLVEKYPLALERIIHETRL